MSRITCIADLMKLGRRRSSNVLTALVSTKRNSNFSEQPLVLKMSILKSIKKHSFFVHLSARSRSVPICRTKFVLVLNVISLLNLRLPET